MPVLILALFLVAAQASAPAPVTINGLEIPVPAGWTHKEDPGGSVVLQPPPPRNSPLDEPVCMILVLPAQPMRGTFWETHCAVFEEVLKSLPLTNLVAPIHEPNSPGHFIRSSTAGDDAGKRIQAVRLYSALSADGIQCVLVVGQEDFATTGPMLHQSRVTRPPKESPRPKIVEAYRRLKQQADVNVHRGEYLVGSVPYERIWFRDDGVADFSAVYPEGHAASAAAPKVDRALQYGSYGSWKAVGNREVHVVRHASKPVEVYRRENGKLRLGDQVWEAMPSVDGMKLDGRWRLPVPAGQPARSIEFTAAGRFKDDGVLEDVGSFPVFAWAGSRVVFRDRPPPRGAGTYEIREFTLLVKYDDGRAWSTDFSTAGADPKDRSKLLLRGGILHREP